MVMQKRPEPILLEGNLLSIASQQGLLQAYNAVFDKQGHVMKRPGLIKNASVNGQNVPIFGLFYWTAINKLISVISGRIYSIADMTTSDKNISGTTFLAQKPIEFADTGYWLYLCAGSGRLVKWNGVEPTVKFEADSVCPNDIASVEAYNTRILAVENGKNRLWYTKPADTSNPYNDLEFDGYIEITKIGEPIVAIKRLGSELVVLKEKSISLLYDDGITPFKMIIGSEHNTGIAARNSLITIGEALYFLSSEGRLVRYQGRRLTSVSEQWFQRSLDKLKYIDDCIAFRQYNHIILQFPTEKITYVYDFINKRFSQFSMLENGQDRPYIGYSCAEIPTAGRTKNWLVGGKNGIRYYADYNQYTDDGENFRFRIKTSHLDWGTNRRKHSTRLIVKVSTESFGGVDPFKGIELGIPDATRCESYTYTFKFNNDLIVSSISGLPVGLSFNEATQTINGAVSSVNGTFNLTVIVRDNRGASKSFPAKLVVKDFIITAGVIS